MKRRLELESRKIKHSLSQEKILSSKNHLLNKNRVHIERFHNINWMSPRQNNLISSNDISDSFDTCIFPSTDLSSLSSKKKKINNTGVQTEESCCCLDSLKQENILLAGEVKELRNEVNELKEIVKEMQNYKSKIRIETNEEIIEQLQKKNLILKKGLRGKDIGKLQDEMEDFSEY